MEIYNKYKEEDAEIVVAIEELMNEEGEDKEGNRKVHTRTWGAAFRYYVMQKEREPDFVHECPQEIRESAVHQFFMAMHSTKAKEEEQAIRNEKKKKSELKFRSKKSTTQSIAFRGRTWNNDGKIYKLFSSMKTGKEKLPSKGKLECEVKITKDKIGRFFFCITNEIERKGENKTPSSFHKTAVLDPGVRTFNSIYDPDGQSIEWGAGDMKQIFFLCRQGDKIQSKLSEGITTSRRKACHRKLAQIKNKINECHAKLALFLCENYKVILIPKFDVSRMIRKRDRKLHTKTIRSMCTWSHFRFRQTLMAKAECFKGVKVVIVNEAYTSKTCDECGHIHTKLGGNKVFKCPECGNIADRDVHAAKNILRRYLTRELLITIPRVPRGL